MKPFCQRFFASTAAISLLAVLALPLRSDDTLSDTQPTSDLGVVSEQAEKLLKSSFSNFQFYSVKPSIIDGLYEIDTGSNIVYYSAKANVLLFGEMYNHLGENLSDKAIAIAAKERLKDLDLSVALEIGPEGAPTLTEYSNPLCGWCQRLHGWLESDMASYPVRRQIIFAVGHSAEAQNLAEHILCSDNPELAFEQVYSRRRPAALKRCDDGYARVQKHIQITTAAGVSSTPTLFADGERIRGFDEGRLRDYLLNASRGAQASGGDTQ